MRKIPTTGTGGGQKSKYRRNRQTKSQLNIINKNKNKQKHKNSDKDSDMIILNTVTNQENICQTNSNKIKKNQLYQSKNSARRTMQSPKEIHDAF